VYQEKKVIVIMNLLKTEGLPGLCREEGGPLNTTRSKGENILFVVGSGQPLRGERGEKKGKGQGKLAHLLKGRLKT